MVLGNHHFSLVWTSPLIWLWPSERQDKDAREAVGERKMGGQKGGDDGGEELGEEGGRRNHLLYLVALQILFSARVIFH